MATDITRLPAPSGPYPSVRRKIPKPFERPSINIGGGGAGPKREWRSVFAADLRVGDNVPSVGRIVEVAERYQMPTAEEARSSPFSPDLYSWDVTVTGAGGIVRTYKGWEHVFAFTAGEPSEP